MNHINDKNDHKLFSNYYFFLNNKNISIIYLFKK